ncbi:Ca2+-modulated nonselective cation channel polycystin [Cercospora zeina]
MASTSWRTSTLRALALFAVWQSLVQPSWATSLATVTPCPECGSSIAPKPITITAQYQTVSTCTPSTTTVFSSYTTQYTVGTPSRTEKSTVTTSKIETVPSCSAYAWVSTTIPVYQNDTKTSSIITTTNQPVTFRSWHYTDSHTTTIELPQYPQYAGNGAQHQNGTHRNGTVQNGMIQNGTHIRSTTKVSYTTIDVKKYCRYDSLGPIAIPNYKGSGLCTDCGDASSALTQRLTVVSCSDKHCTTFNETWIASRTTYSASGRPHTATATNTYCPTATPETAMPGYTRPAPTGSPSSTPPSGGGEHPTGSYPSEGGEHPTGTYSHSPTTTPCSTTPSPSHPPAYSSPPTYSNTEDEPEPTDGYGGEPDPPADPSGDMGYEEPAPTAYHPGPSHYKVFKRRGLERPRGTVMKRGGTLFWGT